MRHLTQRIRDVNGWQLESKGECIELGRRLEAFVKLPSTGSIVICRGTLATTCPPEEGPWKEVSASVNRFLR